MNTTCWGCGKTDDVDLMYWVRDQEGNWWHRECRRDDLRNRLKRMEELGPRLDRLIKFPDAPLPPQQGNGESVPRLIDTRKQRAAELVKLATAGPDFSALGRKLETPDDFGDYARETYTLWARSWLLPLIRQLVPELRSAALSKK